MRVHAQYLGTQQGAPAPPLAGSCSVYGCHRPLSQSARPKATPQLSKTSSSMAWV